MLVITGFSNSPQFDLPDGCPTLLPIDLAAELASIEAESIGWQPLAQGAYLHRCNANNETVVIQIVGTPDQQMVGLNVLLLVD